jgi:hypothetical protein
LEATEAEDGVVPHEIVVPNLRAREEKEREEGGREEKYEGMI